MQLIRRLTCCLLSVAVAVSFGCTHQHRNRDLVYQSSTIDALLSGVYDGPATVAALRTYGDYGLGCMNALDGEMVAIDGEFYRIRHDGIVHRCLSGEQMPFACVTYFEPDSSFALQNIESLDRLMTCIDEKLISNNRFYAIRIEGRFDYIKTRSVPRQEKPYPPLVEAIKEQSEFELRGVTGTLFGFRSPPFVKGIGVPGYHLHFLSKDRTSGGHVLELKNREIEVELDDSNEFLLVLPESEEFHRVNLSEQREAELQKVER